MINWFYGKYAGTYEWHNFLCSDGGDIQSARCGYKRYNYIGKVSAGLLHKHIEEIEGS